MRISDMFRFGYGGDGCGGNYGHHGYGGRSMYSSCGGYGGRSNYSSCGGYGGHMRYSGYGGYGGGGYHRMNRCKCDP